MGNQSWIDYGGNRRRSELMVDPAFATGVGGYTCIASNAYGNSSAMIPLTKNYLTYIVGLPVGVFTFGVMFIVLVFLLLIMRRPCGKYVSLKFGLQQQRRSRPRQWPWPRPRPRPPHNRNHNHNNDDWDDGDSGSYNFKTVKLNKKVKEIKRKRKKTEKINKQTIHISEKKVF